MVSASDAKADALFGWVVALSGSTALITAFNDNHGKAYIFERDAGGTWIEKQKLIPVGWMGLDYYGHSAALDGDVLVASAPGDDDKAPQAGSLYVFTRDAAGTWTQTAKLLASDGSADDRLGNDQSLAISGKLCLVGAWRADPYGEDSGAAYLFAVGPDLDGDGLMDACECPGDINQDWVVNQSDLGLLLHAFGACPGDAGYHAAAGTLDSGGGPGGDPCVDQSDLGVLLAHYGAVCP